MKFRIDTTISPDGKIQQDLIQGHTKMITRWIVDTREEGIRNSLIKLGWTPPGEEYKDETAKTWFVLLEGSSEDGRGVPNTVDCKTTNKQRAEKFFRDAQRNPYTTSGVLIITDKQRMFFADPWTDWEAL